MLNFESRIILIFFLFPKSVKSPANPIILRIDINSSINPENGEILDDTRIRRHAATVKELSEKKSKIIILAHQSRPGKLDFVNLKEHAKRMSEMIGIKIKFIKDIYGKKAVNSISKLNNGDILMLDNVRFDKEEVEFSLFDNDNFDKQTNSKM